MVKCFLPDLPSFCAHLKVWERALLVTEFCSEDTLRVVETLLSPSVWMCPVEKTEEDLVSVIPFKTQAKTVALENYGLFLEDDTLTDVVLVVDGERFPAHQSLFAAQSEYFRFLFLSGIQGGSSECGMQEIEQVSAGAFRVVLRYLYMTKLPESGEGGAGARG